MENTTSTYPANKPAGLDELTVLLFGVIDSNQTTKPLLRVCILRSDLDRLLCIVIVDCE